VGADEIVGVAELVAAAVAPGEDEIDDGQGGDAERRDREQAAHVQPDP
jgi:hypothetical protein